MKILIINSDSPNNRGDRAILLGGIKLIRRCFPDSEIWSVSDKFKRDKDWFGINFLPMSVHTLNPLNLLRLGLFARNCDIVFWGGGELLKDYTNKLGLMYWIVKLLIVRIFSDKIYGFYQGIGPTESTLSRKLIVFIVNRLKHFFVRDGESAQKLTAWGVKIPVTASYDPAVLCTSQPLDKDILAKLSREFNITADFLKNAIGIGARKWFHYKKSSWIPFRFLEAIDLGNKNSSIEVEHYKAHLAMLCDRLSEEQEVNIIFFPMHTSISENDAGFSGQVQQLMKNKTRTRIIEKDLLSPQEFHNVIGACKAFISFRLHSFILATVANVPAIVFYYVDKGRIFADQIGMSNNCFPIEDILDAETIWRSEEKVSDLMANCEEITESVALRINEMRVSLITEFNKTLR